ncbi:MAG: carbon-nitrogen family hydrolase [Paenibacillus sp.]|uniref:carbon-nitrogen family hydrolase n=1 Tax=Paenibacillus sp. TaxID=58172 RepID=UPI0025E9606A|nr:carbon-nitrogen family hydrolase [Paenibacillus sp.]MBR2563288.1 carbon-nitrogen family hydrolase [Paenibacillus sp.]
MTEQQREMRVALIQGDIKLGDPEANHEHMKHLLERAVELHPDLKLAVLPELWNTGYALPQIHELADPEGQRSREWLSAFAQKHQISIVGGSIAEKREGQIYNTMYAYNEEGIELSRYDKLHLFRLMDEEKYFEPGAEPEMFEIGNGLTAGASICYDIRFPELARTLALNGARALIVPAEWPNPRLHHWRTLLTARAIENQMYVIACNRVGKEGDTEFFGHSMIIDPWGEIVAEGGEGEEIVSGVIRPSLVDEVRGRIPVFEDRRPSIYSNSK